MNNRLILLICFLSFIHSAMAQDEKRILDPATLLYPGEERHLSHIKQLTFGGDNAEAYFSFNNRQITFQAHNKAWGNECDQIYRFEFKDGDMKKGAPQRISNGKGRTTCSYFLPGDSLILYASTFEADSACPPVPAHRADGKYVWAIYPGFDIYVADLKGNIRKKLTDSKGYDAEGTVSPDGKKIVFTSMRSGDPELYTMNIDGTDVKQITDELGYDGGAFFSPDSKQLIFRSSRPGTAEKIAEYKELISENLVMPTEMSLYICDADGKNKHKITDLANANWAPFFHPSGKKIIFASDYKSTRGLPFNLYMINTDGKGLEQITFDGMFDAFPMFSPDGKKLIFSSNRNNNGTHDTNLFIADWKD